MGEEVEEVWEVESRESKNIPATTVP
jgi:hypothetical protein